MVLNIPWDNKWVVPYNTWLLKKYSTYINIGACINAKFIAYLYKYIFKQSNSANISTTVNVLLCCVNQAFANRNNNEDPIDKLQAYNDARLISACKAA